MTNFIKINRKLLIYSSIILFIVPIFGLKSLVSLFGNILILIFLIPFLLFLIILVGFNFLKSSVNQCPNCGNSIVGFTDQCPYCGSNIDLNLQTESQETNASNETIEVEAEEIK